MDSRTNRAVGLSGGLGREEDDHSGQSTQGTWEDAEEEGERVGRLNGDRNVATASHGICVRNYSLVWEMIQRRVSAPATWKLLRLVFLKKPDAKLQKGVPCHRVDVSTNQVVRGSGGVCKSTQNQSNGRSYAAVERCVNCEHMQAFLTNTLQSYWALQQDQREAWVPGVKTAFESRP